MCDAGSARKRVFLWLCVHACACLWGCAHARVQVWIRVCERVRGQGVGCGATGLCTHDGAAQVGVLLQLRTALAAERREHPKLQAAS